MTDTNLQSTFDTLRTRVLAVAAVHRRCSLAEGAGWLVWVLGLPLLATAGLERAIGLPFWLRAPVLPLLGVAAAWWGWRRIIRPLRERYTPTRAALLVEAKRPELGSRLVSALEVFPDLEAERPRFDSAMVGALVLHTQRATAQDDFRAVIDRTRARRQLIAGGVTLLLWLAVFIFDSAGMSRALGSFVSAWDDVRNVAQKATGAEIVVAPLDRPAYLTGSSVTLHATQQGFRSGEMQVFTRNEGDAEWHAFSLQVDSGGHATHSAANASKTFECYFASNRIQSRRVTVVITERPRIVNLTVEYELPAYARRAPIVQPRSDGNLKALFGSSVILTVEANKPLKSLVMTRSFAKEPEPFSVGGRHARDVVRLDLDKWRADERAAIPETYRLTLTDEFGYTNADADRDYELVVQKDQPPVISFVGLPHKSSAQEPHILEKNLAGIALTVRAKDDWGLGKITLHYRIEDLDTGAEKLKDSRVRRFDVPRAEVPQLSLLRLAEIGATVGQRVVFWAEAEDTYDLEPGKGPHTARTPAYKLAVVSQEDMFTEVAYKDDWSTQWYDSLKVATLSDREIPVRQSPDREPPAKVAEKLLNAPQVTDRLRGADRRLVQDYFDSLNAAKTK
ncbi:hypothetical protein LBMAG56_21080 [Verrucomicrobiota bacterium]|nr:hypothetical protein LBMAG56_21080 [Verrucomicrobiota bacterium]